MSAAHVSSVRPSVRRRNRILKIVVALVLLLLLIGYPIVSYVGYNFLSLVPKAAVSTPSGAYEEVKFPSRGQSYEVYAFYLPGQPDAPALINVHGWKGTRFHEHTQKRAESMRALGYTVLSIDLSDSAGTTVGNGRISMGAEERYDVLGAFDYLIGRGFAPDRIGLVGESMGATTVLLAAALEPQIKAVWADSPFARPNVVASEQAATFGFPPIIVPGGMLLGAAMTGTRIWEVAAIEQGAALAANNTNIQLVHCEGDGFVFYHHSQDILAAYQAANAEVALWTVPCLSHASAVREAADYETRLDAFFRPLLVAKAG